MDDTATRQPAVAPPEPAPNAKDAPAGAETLIGDHVKASLDPAPRKTWFWLNLALLIVLAPLAMVWFNEHLEPYVTQVVLIGGGITLWAVVRLIWEVIEKMTKLDPWDRSRSLLASPAITRLLVVAALMLGALWFFTSSLYFEHAGSGAGESEYVVQVMRKPGQLRFIDDVTVTPSEKIFGSPYFWNRADAPLECRIVKPPGFDAFDCSLHAGKSTRVKVPGSFSPKDLHLLRLLPAGMTYAELPEAGDPRGTLHRIEMTVDGKTYPLDDVRKQTVYIGGTAEDMDLAMKLEKPQSQYQDELVTLLRAAQIDEEGAKQTASVLSASTRPWNAIRTRPGQKISFSMRWSKTTAGKEESGLMPGFPVVYTVTSDKVQTVWLPSR